MKSLGISMATYSIFKSTFNFSGFTSNEAMWISFGLRVPSVSNRRCIVRPVSTISSTITTVRSVRSSVIPITSLITPVEDTPLIRSQLHERNLAGNSNVFHQISSKHKRAVQDAEKQRVFTSQIAVDFICNAGYFFQNVLFLDGNSELFVFYLYGVHKGSIFKIGTKIQFLFYSMHHLL